MVAGPWPVFVRIVASVEAPGRASDLPAPPAVLTLRITAPVNPACTIEETLRVGRRRLGMRPRAVSRQVEAGSSGTDRRPGTTSMGQDLRRDVKTRLRRARGWVKRDSRVRFCPHASGPNGSGSLTSGDMGNAPPG